MSSAFVMGNQGVDCVSVCASHGGGGTCLGSGSVHNDCHQSSCSSHTSAWILLDVSGDSSGPSCFSFASRDPCDNSNTGLHSFYPKAAIAQRISVALHRATALEILQSRRMGPVEGRDLY